MKPTVYIETTVISYLTSRPSRDLIVAGHQQITQDWWENELPKFEAFISTFVLDEIFQGDRVAANKRIQVVQGFSILQSSTQVVELAERYNQALNIPQKSELDALHLAIATGQGIDYLVSWNCKHIASGRVRLLIESINNELGIRTPVICTPEELMEE
ncbi:type II toxin-antitoxin system VapC family toxin [Deltaproteobacteria bacterium TL4]